MIYRLIVLIGAVIFVSCTPEEMSFDDVCDIHPEYHKSLNQIYAADVFDIGVHPVKKVNNDRIEFTVLWDIFFEFLADSNMNADFDLLHYESFTFVDTEVCKITTLNNGEEHEFRYDTTDCSVTFKKGEFELFGEFKEAGKLLSLNRYAIYSHHTQPNGLDTFTFVMNIDWRIGSMRKAAEHYQMLNPGLVDTILIERVENELK